MLRLPACLDTCRMGPRSPSSPTVRLASPTTRRSPTQRYAVIIPSAEANADPRVLLQLWMGTHPSCPSVLLDTKQSLKDYLVAHSELLGEKVIKHFGEDLPFLFKVRWEEGTERTRAHPLGTRAGPRYSQGVEHPGSSRQETRSEALC
jgi:hypothetical protein